MKNESVAIFDIRSYTLTFMIGGRGVNGTFVYRGSESENYDGYGTEGFFDVSSFTAAGTYKSVVTMTSDNYRLADGVCYVKLQGACAGCMFADMTIQNTVEEMLVSEIPEVIKVVNIQEALD